MEAHSTKLVLTGETTGVIKKRPVLDNLQDLFNKTSIGIKFYDKYSPELEDFLRGGSGCLFADTYVGLEAVRKVAEFNNEHIPVVFLTEPGDTFFDAERLKSIGPRIIGVYNEILTMENFVEIVKSANQGFLEQEVHFT